MYPVKKSANEPMFPLSVYDGHFQNHFVKVWPFEKFIMVNLFIVLALSEYLSIPQNECMIFTMVTESLISKTWLFAEPEMP
jgi:hypothetical protein